jgi:hypothetical protein
MNTMKSSSKVLLLYYLYSNANELDYSSRVMIMIYELVYSLCVMILTCKTLCLIIHISYMSIIRAKLRWWFIMPSSVPKSFTCRSVGSRTRGIWVVFVYASMVLGYGEIDECISYSMVEG